MVIFHSYVSLPEGNHHLPKYCLMYFLCYLSNFMWLPSGHQTWLAGELISQLCLHPFSLGISQLATFDYQRVYIPFDIPVIHPMKSC